jgi:hypothetical protein
MKLSTKKFGSIATAAVLAGTMAFMPATALAAQVSSNDTGAATQITKTWEVPSPAQYSASEAFTFELTYNKDKVEKVLNYRLHTNGSGSQLYMCGWKAEPVRWWPERPARRRAGRS